MSIDKRKLQIRALCKTKTDFNDLIEVCDRVSKDSFFTYSEILEQAQVALTHYENFQRVILLVRGLKRKGE